MGVEQSCTGRLVVHRGGTVAFCTEEAAGRACPGYETPHPSGTDTCWQAIAAQECRVCASQS